MLVSQDIWNEVAKMPTEHSWMQKYMEQEYPEYADTEEDLLKWVESLTDDKLAASLTLNFLPLLLERKAIWMYLEDHPGMMSVLTPIGEPGDLVDLANLECNGMLKGETQDEIRRLAELLQRIEPPMFGQLSKPSNNLSATLLPGIDSPEKIEILGKLIHTGAKLGYAYLKRAALFTFNAFSEWFKNTFGPVMREQLGFAKSDIDILINDIWNTKITIEGDRKALKEHIEDLRIARNQK